jgi:hypothetical protein
LSKLALRTLKNVEILHAGIEYKLSTGPTTFTPQHLVSVVMAANEDPSIPNPRLKLGHIDPRFNGPEFDATPSFGKATNLRLSENGMAVMGDYIGVPAWLAGIMATAYPSRSVEGFWDVESHMGKKWPFVLSACSLLGVTWPGVTMLEDLPLMYGEDIPECVVFADAELVAATGGDPAMKLPFTAKDGTAASANLDDVRRAFYNEYLTENPDANWWWIQAILTDPNELIVEDDESGQLYKISFSSDDKGAVSFGDAAAVRVDYIPESREATKAAAPHVAATLAIGRQVLASWQTRAASRPDTQGGVMDPKEIRQRLSLPEDASDEQVQEALQELNTAAGVTPEGAAAPAGDGINNGPEAHGGVTPGATGMPEPSADNAQPDPAPVARAAGNFQLPEGLVVIDKGTLEELKVGASAGLELKSRFDKNETDTAVMAAVNDGRIPPSRKEFWTKYLEKDPEGGKAALASLAPGLVPLRERELGHSGGGLEGGTADELGVDVVQGWSGEIFPEVRERQAREAAAASGALNRSRVHSDAHYSR